jgi:hypothetical protein
MNTPTDRRICPCCHRRLPPTACLEPARREQLASISLAPLRGDELAAQVELIEDRDFAGLVAHLEKIVARRDGDLTAVKDLGEAYLMNGQPERAIELLAPVHRRWPDFEDVRWVILDALFCLGRDETGFVWTRAPAVLRPGAGVRDACWAYLARKGEPRDLEELYCELLALGYCAFDERRLLADLARDPRFAVEEGPYWTAVGLATGGDP